MTRWKFALPLIAGFLFGGIAVANPPLNTDETSKIVARLDVILKRLDAIEQRLAKLETNSPLFADWWVDERGVMRSDSGRAIGFWGIDGPVKDRRR